ncbi:MAG: enoyl-CoA hydratase [Burkholderiales bacterium]|nr:MAG: enoyl-CoA hydratase [Burkholderiales bacterium]
MTNDSVLWNLDARGVATVTLNRPAVNNAYDAQLLDGVMAAMDALGERTELRVVVMVGAGRHFQAGADLAWLEAVAAQSAAENLHASQLTAQVVHRLNTLPVPTVALVQGACFGGGTGIVAACDVAIAADNAQFSIAETRWGLMAGIIVPQLADAIGARQLRRYALTGERFDAHEARRIGLVHEVVPTASLQSAGARVVDHLLQNAPQANAQTKALAIEYAWGDVSAQSYARLVEQHAAKRQSVEASEGFASFREKRPAAWYPGPAPTEEA